jgi:hypothetical protein
MSHDAQYPPATSSPNEPNPQGSAPQRGPNPTDPVFIPYEYPRPTLPKRRPNRSYSKQQKLEVLSWLATHEVRDPKNRSPQDFQGVGCWTLMNLVRPPTVQEAAERFNIPLSTLYGWCRNRESLGSPVIPRRAMLRMDPNVRLTVFSQCDGLSLVFQYLPRLQDPPQNVNFNQPPPS